MIKYILSVNYSYHYNYQAMIGVFDKKDVDRGKSDWLKDRSNSCYNTQLVVDYWTLYPIDERGNVCGEPVKEYYP